MTGVGGSNRFQPLAIPTASTPNAFIAALWGDNETRTPGVCVATTGSTPNRQWVVEWRDAYYFFGVTAAHLTFEVILTEGSNTIDLVYGTMTHVAGYNRTVGLENQTGTMGLNGCPGATGRCQPVTGTVIRYVPIP